MKMKYLIIILSHLIVIFARPEHSNFVGFSDDGKRLCRGFCVIPDNCPLVDCDSIEKSQRKPFATKCPAAECWDSTKRSILWPAENPFQYIQCHPVIGGWDALTRDCSCSTYFDFEKQICVYPFEWTNFCHLSEPLPPPIDCQIEFQIQPIVPY